MNSVRHMAPELLVLRFLLGMSALILMTHLYFGKKRDDTFHLVPCTVSTIETKMPNLLRRHSTGKLLEQRPGMERSPRFSYEEEGRETATDRAPVGALAWESVQAMAGQGRATDRAATGDQA